MVQSPPGLQYAPSRALTPSRSNSILSPITAPSTTWNKFLCFLYLSLQLWILNALIHYMGLPVRLYNRLFIKDYHCRTMKPLAEIKINGEKMKLTILRMVFQQLLDQAEFCILSPFLYLVYSLCRVRHALPFQKKPQSVSLTNHSFLKIPKTRFLIKER